MTPLEALAAGVPIVVLDTPVAREVYGERRSTSRAGDIDGTAQALRSHAEQSGRGRCPAMARAPGGAGALLVGHAADETLGEHRAGSHGDDGTAAVDRHRQLQRPRRISSAASRRSPPHPPARSARDRRRRQRVARRQRRTPSERAGRRCACSCSRATSGSRPRTTSAFAPPRASCVLLLNSDTLVPAGRDRCAGRDGCARTPDAAVAGPRLVDATAAPSCRSAR